MDWTLDLGQDLDQDHDLDMGLDLELDNKGCPRKFLFSVAIAT